MSDPTHLETAPAPSASAPEFVATIATLLLAIVGLLFVDEFLARIDRHESLAHAANLYADGRAALAARQPRTARDRFQAAVALDRTNIVFQVALAEAMVAEGHLTEAEQSLRAVLSRAETDGAANLLLARVLLREGRAGEAKSYYHRAIFGRWGFDSLAQRLRARMELVALLDRAGAPAELLAELLPMQEALKDSMAFRRSLGTLFLHANSPARSVEVLEEVLRDAPGDVEARRTLSEAALALGDFRSARANLAQVVHARPRDTTVTAELRLADTALALDPTVRGIGSRLRRARSYALLEGTLDVARACPHPSAEAVALADSATALTSTPPATAADTVETDAILELAAALWLDLPADCRTGGSATDRAVALLQQKLAH